jgi:hypothetical protein
MLMNFHLVLWMKVGMANIFKSAKLLPSQRASLARKTYKSPIVKLGKGKPLFKKVRNVRSTDHS